MTTPKLGKLVIEGKTKRVFDLPDSPGLVYVESKDRITAGDGVKAHDLEGKAAISTATTAKVFELLNSAGIPTHFKKLNGSTSFIAEKCAMVPIEWVTRRLATGSFLKRNPGVPEGFRFAPPCQETFLKDDANHDPQWCQEQIISAKYTLNGLTIGQAEVLAMQRITICVFEVLERAWSTLDCALVDMKIEFGITEDGRLVVADVIDSDSWRLWPSGDKRLMKDKQVYRDLGTNVTQQHLETVKRNFQWVADQLEKLLPQPRGRVVVFMGSASDVAHCREIKRQCTELGVPCELRVSSAHKGPQDTLRMAAEYEADADRPLVIIAVAGRSNGLGPVLSGNVSCPVINCPPGATTGNDVWSSLNVPSGLGCTTVLYPGAAALAAASILGQTDHVIWSKLRAKQMNTAVGLLQTDKNLE
ncbi:Hypothetical predicted protein [Cloeon dipterum]|uniref:PurE domain-containing protein n=1 Tax=Cloeon dipterum TaxID=197152 RepID=A0A8S1C5F1_9INSE|nr:Hypothetical predicted protein [Cloeon dipterum]